MTVARALNGLQADYDLETALDDHGDAIRRDVQPMDA